MHTHGIIDDCNVIKTIAMLNIVGTMAISFSNLICICNLYTNLR